MLGERIKRLRLAKGIYQQDLADALSVSKSAIGMWERGNREPDIAMLQKIASFFDVSVSELLGEPEQTGKEIYEKIKNAAAGDDARSRVIELVSRLSPEQSYLAS